MRRTLEHEVNDLEEMIDHMPLDHRSPVVDSLDTHSTGVEVAGRTKHPMYPAKVHARKVVKELGVREGLIYLPGKPTEFYEDSDMSPEFRQRKYFHYMTGVNVPDCAATYNIKTSHLTLWIPYVQPRQALYFGRPFDAAAAKKLYDVDEVRYTDDLAAFLRDQLSNQKLFLIHPLQAPSNVSSLVGDKGIDTQRLRSAMNRARVIKTDYEIALIRKACEISSAGHKAITEQLLKLDNECEVQAIFTAICQARGSLAMSYPVIAGAGENGATLHYTENSSPLKGNELIVIDAGCEWQGYASDITRTLPISGKFRGKAADIYSIVEDMQEACIERAVPGKAYYELHLLAASIALDGLLQLGVLKGKRDDIWAQGTIGAFFPHGLGHHVGLEVHDVSGDLPLMVAASQEVHGKGIKREILSPSGLTELLNATHAVQSGPRSVLEPGMVVTVEPGIYFCRPYLEGYFLDRPEHARYIDTKVLDKYYPVGGVRIEDVILITKDGNENLSAGAPKGLNAVTMK